MEGIFLIFCMKLQQHKDLKLAEMIFFGPKVAHSGAKMKFFKFYERYVHVAFLVFAGSYIKFLHKSLKLTGMFFLFCFLCFFFFPGFIVKWDPK